MFRCTWCVAHLFFFPTPQPFSLPATATKREKEIERERKSKQVWWNPQKTNKRICIFISSHTNADIISSNYLTFWTINQTFVSCEWKKLKWKNNKRGKQNHANRNLFRRKCKLQMGFLTTNARKLNAQEYCHRIVYRLNWWAKTNDIIHRTRCRLCENTSFS